MTVVEVVVAMTVVEVVTMAVVEVVVMTAVDVVTVLHSSFFKIVREDRTKTRYMFTIVLT